EDGIRDFHVTGVQTCALPISRPTRSRSFKPFCVASSWLRPSTFTCASVRLRVTLMCGNSSKFWNTMPILERNFGRSVFGSPTEMPSTVISPFWNGSRPFTHLMRVDFPLPDGPHTTTTSPFFTSVEQSVRTWKAPYHLLTFLSEIMGLYLTMAMRSWSRLTRADSPYETTKYTAATKLYISTRR